MYIKFFSFKDDINDYQMMLMIFFQELTRKTRKGAVFCFNVSNLLTMEMMNESSTFD